MRLYLVNHHHAVPREDVEDMSRRPLSDKGRADVKKFTDFLNKNGEKVDRVLHVETSWTRENAELLGEQLGGATVESTSYPLQADDDITPFVVDANGFTDNVMLAGPSNICLKTASHLLTGNEEPYVVTLGNGVCVCLERDDAGAWSLQWMIRPEQL